MLDVPKVINHIPNHGQCYATYTSNDQDANLTTNYVKVTKQPQAAFHGSWFGLPLDH